MKHLDTLKLDHPDVVKMMDDIKSIENIYKDYEYKKIPSLEHKLREGIGRKNRLSMIMHGKLAELYESIQLIYDIGEPKSGFEIQFNFKQHSIRMIKSGTPHDHRHASFGGHIDGEQWKDGDNDDVDESQIDWENPAHVEIYNKQREEHWKIIRAERQATEGIDWQAKEKEEKDDDDDEPPEMQRSKLG